MAGLNEDQKTPGFGIYTKAAESAGITPADVIALALSVLWLVGMGLFLIFAGGDMASGDAGSLPIIMAAIALIIPVALIWVAAAGVRSSRIMQQESQRLQSAIDAMRHSYLEQQQNANAVKPSVEHKLDEIAAAQRKTDAAIATFNSVRPRADVMATDPPSTPSQPQSPPVQEPSLPLGIPDTAPEPLSVADFISALHFPESGEDMDGFRALRRAMQDHSVSQLVQAAQDMLTLLSHEGVYMDDHHPDRARPEIWRKFAQGERGKTISTLGGIRDRESLALVADRMRQDSVFRDSVHHFLRKFDHTFTEFEKHATDQEISDLTNTRTARAFMLLGRVSGTFD